MPLEKRGLSHAEAIAYVGVKRRTFDEIWRPQLTAMRQGSVLLFDRHELDQLFDRFKSEAQQPESAPLERPAQVESRRAGRPSSENFYKVSAEILARKKKLRSK